MHRPATYQIRIQGHVDPAWLDCFEHMLLTHNCDDTTTISGPVADQSALYGMLGMLRDLGIELVSVNPVEASSDLVGDLGTRLRGSWSSGARDIYRTESTGEGA